jgi:TetR/AcrR family transcriptional regulator, regulator of cefoperazone and chloramphenicol sensitivity
MKHGGGDRETRDRLLKAAERLFSERGFKDVTVREICRAAHANVAAVNYHFGDKLGLYRDVLRRAIDGMRHTTESARRAGEGRPPEEQLRHFVGVFMHALLAPGHERLHKLIDREVRDPTPALDDLVEQGVRPRIEYLSGVIASLLGCDRSDPRVLRCVGSVQAQSIVFTRPNAVSDRLGFRFEPTESAIDDAARHIAEFSIGGIRAIGRHRRR